MTTARELIADVLKRRKDRQDAGLPHSQQVEAITTVAELVAEDGTGMGLLEMQAATQHYLAACAEGLPRRRPQPGGKQKFPAVIIDAAGARHVVQLSVKPLEE